MAATTTRWSWKQSPELMARLRVAQNHPAHESRDVLTFVGFLSSEAELERHVLSIEGQAADYDVRATLADLFGREWLRLSHADQALIVRDCLEEGGVDDYAEYRRNIGARNLQAYANSQRVRFAPAGTAVRLKAVR